MEDTSFRLAWEAPSQSITPIQKYEIDVDGGFYGFTPGDTCSDTVSGLSAGQLYTVQVRAENLLQVRMAAVGRSAAASGDGALSATCVV